MKAKIFKTSAEFSNKHFQGRTKEKNALAISSNQSQIIGSFDQVAENFQDTLDAMTPETVRPDFWGGYRVKPSEIEFWQGGADRLHDRFRYLRDGQSWQIDRLAP